MHDILIAIMYITIFGLLFESCLVFWHFKNRLHAYLLISCITTLVNNAGYLLEITSKTGDAYMTALKLSYTGRIWISLSLFLFAAELCREKIPLIIRRSLVVINCILFAGILTLDQHDLYYTSCTFETGGMFPVLSHENGIFHHIYIQLTVIYIIVAFLVVFCCHGIVPLY